MSYRSGDGVEAFVRELAGCVAAEPTEAAVRLLRYLEDVGVDVAALMGGTVWPPENPDARIVLKRICSEFEEAIAVAEAPKGGMQPVGIYRGDFEAMTRNTHTLGKLRWWVREFRGVLGKDVAGTESAGQTLPGQTWRLKDLLRLRSPVLVQVHHSLAVVSAVAAAEGHYTVRYPATDGVTPSLSEDAKVTFISWLAR